MTGCYLSIDFEDFSHDLQRVLGVKKPKTRRDALVLSIRRIMKIVKTSPGSDRLTFFTTGQVARDHGEIIKELSDNGHEILASYYFPRRGDFASFTFEEEPPERFYEYFLVIQRGVAVGTYRDLAKAESLTYLDQVKSSAD